MRNKATLTVGLVMLLTAVGIGFVVGLQLSDSTEIIDNRSDTSEPDQQTPVGTHTVTKTDVSESVDQSETVSIDIDKSNIKENISSIINSKRREAGVNALTTSGRTAEELEEISKEHSSKMAETNLSVHTTDGISSAERYRNNGLSDICRFRAASGSYTISPSANQLEVVGNIGTNSTYYRDGMLRHVTNEHTIAQALVTKWMKNDAHKNRLLRSGIGRMGIGINITDSGSIYATVNLCD